MPLCSPDVIEVGIIKVCTYIGLDIRAARGDQLAAGVDNRDHVRFRRPEALHVRVHRDRAELALQRGLDPIHRQVGFGGGDVGIMNRLHQQALAETGAGIGLIVLQVGAVGLGVAAVDDTQRDLTAAGDMGGVAAADGCAEDTVE
ncbi:hypothetical protein D3C84_864040 [compost metagenome]